jgi:hypothetical protein
LIEKETKMLCLMGRAFAFTYRISPNAITLLITGNEETKDVIPLYKEEDMHGEKQDEGCSN